MIPVYNSEKYIRTCIESILQQTYQQLQIILVNDGSTDQSGLLCEQYAAYDERITIIHQENQGLSAARNKGIEQSIGEFIMFVDSDDWLHPQTCQLALETAQANKADLVFWSYIREYAYHSYPKKVLPYEEEIVVFPEQMVHNYLRRRMFGFIGEELRHPENIDALSTAWGKLYRVSRIKENAIAFQDTKEIGTEDLLFNIQVSKYVRRAVFLNRHFYHYRKDNEMSLTKVNSVDVFQKWQRLFALLKQELENHQERDMFYEALNNRISFSVIGLGILIVRNGNSPINMKAKHLRLVLHDEVYKKCLQQLQLTYFPLHWKVFFYCAKRQLVWPLLLLLWVITKKTKN